MSPAMFKLSILAVALFLGGQSAGSSFDPFDSVSPNRTRGIAGQRVEIPFVVLQSKFDEMTISRNGGQETLAVGRVVRPGYKDRFDVIYNYDVKSWVLILRLAAKSDEGLYSFTVKKRNHTATKDIELRVVESQDLVPWDSTYKCGYNNFIKGSPVQCDLYGAYPCCGTSNTCGLTWKHCGCTQCVDYREYYPEKPLEFPCPITFYFANGRCLKALPQRVGRQEALSKCSEVGAELATSEDSKGVLEAIRSFAADPNVDSVGRGLFWTKGSPALPGKKSRVDRSADQSSSVKELTYVESAMICDESAQRPSECDETLRRPICETPAQDFFDVYSLVK